MKIKKSVLSLAILLVGGLNLFAEENYYGDVSLAYTRSNIEDPDGDKMKLDGYYGGLTFYYPAVNLAGVPFAEAAFLSKSSNVSIYGGKFEAEYDDYDVSIESNTFQIGGQYINSTIPIIVSAEFERTKIEYDFFGSTTTEKNKEYTLGFGYYLADNISMKFNYGHETEDNNDDYLAKSYEIEGKWVNLIDSEKSFALEASYKQKNEDDGSIGSNNEDTEKEKKLSVEGTFYLTNKLGIGAIFQNIQSDDESDEGREYGLNTSFFINKNIGLRGSVSKFIPKDDDQGDKETNFMLEASIRF